MLRPRGVVSRLLITQNTALQFRSRYPHRLIVHCQHRLSHTPSSTPPQETEGKSADPAPHQQLEQKPPQQEEEDTKPPPKKRASSPAATTKPSDAKSAAPSSADAPSKSNGRRRSVPLSVPRRHVQLRELIDPMPPILARSNLEARIMRRESNRSHFEEVPVHTATKKELVETLRVLLDARAKALAERLPSVAATKILAMVSPFKNSDIYVEHLCRAASAELDADFVVLQTRDLFERVPSITALNARVVGTGGGQQVMLMGGGHRRRGDMDFMMRLGGNMAAFVSPSVARVGGGAGEGKRTGNDEMISSVPFPWNRPYRASGGSDLFRFIASETSASGGATASAAEKKPEAVLLIEETLKDVVGAIMELKKKKRNIVVYYRDWMELLAMSGRYADDILKSITGLLRKESGVVFVTPATPTLGKWTGIPGAGRQSRGFPSVLLMRADNEEDEDEEEDEAEEYNDLELDDDKLMDKVIEGRLDYSSLLSHYLGAATVPILPPPRQDLPSFEARLQLDGRRWFKWINVQEMLAIASANGITIELPTLEGQDVGMTYEVTDGLFSDTILERQLLSPAQIERVLLLALGSTSAKANDRANTGESLTVGVDALGQGLEIVTGSIEGMQGATPQRMSLSSREKRLLRQCLIHPAKHVGFSHIGGLSKAKRTVQELIQLPLQRPELFKSGILRQSTTGVLLFGPPGTGKTLLAKAIASESGANFLAVEMGHLQDKYVGENEKNVRALFSLARKLRPCIIFVDEVDALLRKRGHGSPHWAVSTQNDFMSEWDGINSENSGVIVIGATNRPFDLDEAVLRRMPRRILVDLPDEPTRRDILRILLRDEACDEVDLGEIARLTSHYSGSDLKNLCIAAAYHAIREESADGRGDMGGLGGNLAQRRAMKMQHFLSALEDVPASLANEMDSIRQLREWDALFGAKGKGKTIGF
ncbi:uncharacterized protein VTP21DRAFT_5155 [Calcarisporiella thermophila]|uniref:uncharacterized protein n=1 Tax=Calcarisporiella thermophila TaxID=911321 RepID=UPI003742D152